MNLKKLLKSYVNDREQWDREIGRYYSSELYNIISGRMKPKDFFEREKFDLNSCRNIAEGELRELGLKNLMDKAELDYSYQEKEVLEEGGFQIVVKPDFVFKDRLLELKSPSRLPDKITKWYKPQLESQFRAFQKDVYIGYLKERFRGKFFKYEPDNEFWEKIISKVGKFDKQIRKYAKKKKKKNSSE